MKERRDAGSCLFIFLTGLGSWSTSEHAGLDRVVYQFKKTAGQFGGVGCGVHDLLASSQQRHSDTEAIALRAAYCTWLQFWSALRSNLPLHCCY